MNSQKHEEVRKRRAKASTTRLNLYQKMILVAGVLISFFWAIGISPKLAPILAAGVVGGMMVLFLTFKTCRSRLNDLARYQELAKREPWNPNAHLKLARIYENKGERQQAFAEYFLVAEIFFRNGLYPNALAIYKRILEQDPSLDQVRLKIANAYKKMNSLEKAFSQYSQLLHYYQDLGMKDKAQEIMTLMDGSEQKQFEPDEKAYVKYRLVKELSKFQENGNIVPSRNEEEEFFDLGAELDNGMPMDIEGCKEISAEKIYGFDAILKELKESAPPDKLYPNFHYHMGMACSEMGFRNEAIEQFQMAIEKGQNPFEAARLLDLILAEEGSWKNSSTRR